MTRFHFWFDEELGDGESALSNLPLRNQKFPFGIRNSLSESGIRNSLSESQPPSSDHDDDSSSSSLSRPSSSSRCQDHCLDPHRIRKLNPHQNQGRRIGLEEQTLNRKGEEEVNDSFFDFSFETKKRERKGKMTCFYILSPFPSLSLSLFFS